MAPASSDRIVVGVDFGTTFSGVAEAYSGSPASADEINVIKTWPGGNNVTSDKVPSEIAYIDNIHAGASQTHIGVVAEEATKGWSCVGSGSFDFDKLSSSQDAGTANADINSNVRWGLQLKSHESRLQCMKLFLDPRQALPGFVLRSEMWRQLEESGKDATEAVADYLREVCKHAKLELVKRYGAMFVETSDVQWVLTVPAVWSDYAKDATLTAAKKAGMGPLLTMISEPEAAVVYTLQAIQPNKLKKNDNFVVCDAGGGTVDLISYEIKGTNPLRIEESVEGSGACCGGVMLNIKFEEYLKNTLGAAGFARLRKKPKSWHTALKFFEDYLKRNFDPTSREDSHIPMPAMTDDKKAGIEQGFLTMPASAVRAIFGPIITEIIGLVEGQMEKLKEKGKTIAGIVLVGGFGQSRCLHMALKSYFQDPAAKLSANFEVLQPTNAWTAVVRGAVLRGLEGADIVSSRKSRRHYGVSCSPVFDTSVHPSSCKYWDDLEDLWRAENRMSWCIDKGQSVASTEPVCLFFHSNFESRDSKTVTQELIVCDEDRAPDGYGAHTGSSTRVLCRMVVNLSTVPAHMWKAHQAKDGRYYHRLSFELGMQIESARLNFDLRVDGVVYGKVTAKFE